jgi:hypothetical protein
MASFNLSGNMGKNLVGHYVGRVSLLAEGGITDVVTEDKRRSEKLLKRC